MPQLRLSSHLRGAERPPELIFAAGRRENGHKGLKVAAGGR